MDEGAEALVGGSHESRIDLTDALPAHALHRQILNGAQQLGLRRQRQITHFIQKQRTAVGMLELPFASWHTGRRAILRCRRARPRAATRPVQRS